MYFEYVGPVPDTQSNKEKSCYYYKRAPLTTFAHRGFYSRTYLVGEVRDHPLRCFLGLSVCRSGARERGSTDRPVQRPAAPPRNPGIPPSTVSHHRWSSVYDKHTINIRQRQAGRRASGRSGRSAVWENGRGQKAYDGTHGIATQHFPPTAARSLSTGDAVFVTAAYTKHTYMTSSRAMSIAD